LKLFITGGTGFIGQHLIQLLSEKPYEIYLLSRKQDPKLWCEKKNIHIVHGDISKPETYKNALIQCDVLLNLAAEIRDESKMMQTNMEGVEKLISIAAASKINKIIHLSSVGVTGARNSMCKRIVDESVKCEPQNTYEISKLKSENVLLNSLLKDKLIILRPSNVFGDHHSRKILLSLLKHARKGKTLVAGRRSKFNYVYAGDVADVILSFIQNEFSQGVYNVGSPVASSEFFRMIRSYSGMKPKIILLPSFFFYPAFLLKIIGMRELFGKILSLANKVEYCDSKLNRVVNYRYGLDEGIRKTVEYYERSGFLKN
jgi:dihydroflavonol-4-reductase